MFTPAFLVFNKFSFQKQRFGVGPFFRRPKSLPPRPSIKKSNHLAWGRPRIRKDRPKIRHSRNRWSNGFKFTKFVVDEFFLVCAGFVDKSPIWQQAEAAHDRRIVRQQSRRNTSRKSHDDSPIKIGSRSSFSDTTPLWSVPATNSTFNFSIFTQCSQKSWDMLWNMPSADYALCPLCFMFRGIFKADTCFIFLHVGQAGRRASSSIRLFFGGYSCCLEFGRLLAIYQMIVS